MDAQFWNQCWHDGNINFHRSSPNERLVAHYGELGLEQEQTVLVPLCGKTNDLIWLAGQNNAVLGVELSGIAVRAFFEEHNLSPKVSHLGALERFQCARIEILQGDFFATAAEQMAGVCAVYDRAALVALPAEMRIRYVEHLNQILPQSVPILLVTLEYDQSEMSGPPFAVSQEEVQGLFEARHEIHLLEREDVLGNYQRFQEKGMTALTEQVYMLRPHR